MVYLGLAAAGVVGTFGLILTGIGIIGIVRRR